jgi:hypothetical protein
MSIHMSPTIGELAKALAAAQAELEPAKRDATNPHFRSKYADLSACWDAVRAPLARHGLAVSQLVHPLLDRLLVHQHPSGLSLPVCLRRSSAGHRLLLFRYALVRALFRV